jgi:hypothetical protein
VLPRVDYIAPGDRGGEPGESGGPGYLLPEYWGRSSKFGTDIALELMLGI